MDSIVVVAAATYFLRDIFDLSINNRVPDFFV